VKGPQVVVGELGAADRQPQLVQGQVLPDPDGEREGDNLEVEAALVTVADLVEAVAAVGDDPGEDVEPARRALGVGLAPHPGRQGQALLEGDQVRPVGFEHRPLAVEVELVDHVVLQPLLDGEAAGQEAAPDAVGHLPQAQIEAGGLDVVPGDGEAAGRDHPGVDGLHQVLAGQDAVLARRERQHDS